MGLKLLMMSRFYILMCKITNKIQDFPLKSLILQIGMSISYFLFITNFRIMEFLSPKRLSIKTILKFDNRVTNQTD